MDGGSADRTPRSVGATLDAVVTIDATGRVVDLDREAETLLGRRLAELVGRPVSELMIQPGAAPGDVELTVVCTAEAPPLRTGLVRHRDEDPARQTISSMERLLSTAEALANLGSWEFELRSGTALLSDGMYRILGLEPAVDSLELDRIVELVHPEDRSRIGTLLRAMADRPEEVLDPGRTVELRMLRQDGSTVDLHAVGHIERDRLGRPVRWVGSAQDVTNRRLSERELRAHYAVSQALRDWETFEEGVTDLLRRLGTALEYPMGSLWLWAEEERALVCRAFWHAPDCDPEGFEEAKRTLRFPPGVGKPGRAWRTEEPQITADTASDPVFMPREAAIDRGIRSTVSFPAVGPDGPLAVLSFYSCDQRVPGDSLVRTLTGIGRELGRFLDRRRAHLEPPRLSDRELEVLHLAAAGESGPQIAERIVVSPSTVKTHFENIYEKLGVSDRAAAVAQALRTGLFD